MNINCTSLVNICAYHKIANTLLKCVSQLQLSYYIFIFRLIYLSKRLIKLHYLSNYLQTFILCKIHSRETRLINSLITFRNSNPLYLCGFCHIMSMQYKVLINKHVVWILPYKIRINNG